MYGVYIPTFGLFVLVNVGKYTMHGSYGRKLETTYVYLARIHSKRGTKTRKNEFLKQSWPTVGCFDLVNEQ